MEITLEIKKKNSLVKIVEQLKSTKN